MLLHDILTKVSKMGTALSFMAAITVVGCGGGGGSSGGNTGGTTTTGTAGQYFTKKAVGNTWTSQGTYITTSAGQAPTTTTNTDVSTITAFSGGVVTYSFTTTSNGVTSPSGAGTSQLDASGALIYTSGTDTSVDLPANFTVGTTWVKLPANPAIGQSVTNGTVVAFNVTRTVPAGTFTDCLQINITRSVTAAGVTTTYNTTGYISPSAGTLVDGSNTISGSDGSTGSSTWQLQSGYIANP
jgi:hypothetical protein